METNTTLNVGKKLVELCKKGDNMKAIEELYSPDIESHEAMDMQACLRLEMHGIEVEGPFPEFFYTM